MTVGLGFWTLMTWVCGGARGFWGLFAGRVGVGVGEAALSPAAFSLLSDYFPPQRLARAISVYSTGVYFGGGLALMIGGSVIRAVSSAPHIQLPVLGEIFAWQFTFFVVGAIGLPILLLMFTIREPKRRGLKAISADAKVAERPSGWPALRAFLRVNTRTVSCHIAAFSLYGIAIGSYQFWSPSFMMRSHGWTAPRAGFTIGALMFVLGTAGVYCGGWLADRFATLGRRDAILRAALIGMSCGLPFIVATPLVGDDRLATVGLGIAIFFLAFPQGLPAAALQVMTPNPLRAQMTSIYFFIGSLIASGIGPMLPAMLTDYVFKEPVMLRYSVSIVAGCAALLSLLILSFGLTPYRESVQRAEERLG
jgi:MFS family permease